MNLMSRKGFTPILVVIGIFVIIVIADGAYFLGRSTSEPVQPEISQVIATLQPTSSPQVSPDETANWKTHTNVNYSFQYPVDWKIEEKENTVLLSKKVREEPTPAPYELLPSTVIISLSSKKNINNLNVENWAANEVKERGLAGFTPEIKYSTVAGQKALETTLPSRYGENWIVFFYKDLIFTIYTEPIANDGEFVDPVVDQILATFKFTQ